MVTRVIAVENLKKFIGHELSKYAEEFGITIFKDGKQNKGWKGLTLERLAGIDNNNLRAPNGLDFELKSTAFYKKSQGNWTPKETFAITMINPQKLIDTPFFESHCWNKLKSLVYCAVSWYGKHNERSELLKVQSFDFINDENLIKEIENDYEFIRKKLKTQGYEALTGKDGKWIQARTKGTGHGSNSRAFYARKVLIKEIFKI